MFLPLVAHLAAQLFQLGPQPRLLSFYESPPAGRELVSSTRRHGENDGNYILCQRWAVPRREDRAPNDERTLHIDEEALTTRFHQFHTFIFSSLAVRHDATALAF